MTVTVTPTMCKTHQVNASNSVIKEKLMKLSQTTSKHLVGSVAAMCLIAASWSVSAHGRHGQQCENQGVVHHHHHHYQSQPQQPAYHSGYQPGYYAPPPQPAYVPAPRYAPRGSYASYGYSRSPNFGNAVGGALGGLVGSKIGKGSGRLAATAAGSVLGYMLGGQVQHHYR